MQGKEEGEFPGSYVRIIQRGVKSASCTKGLSTLVIQGLVERIIKKVFGESMEIPKKILKEWKLYGEKQVPEDQVLVNKVMGSSKVSQALLDVKEKIEKKQIEKQRYEKLLKRKENVSIPCGFERCKAMFHSEEAAEKHRKLRHTSTANSDHSEESSQDEIPEDVNEFLVAKKQKNRMGQRQRKRLKAVEAFKKGEISELPPAEYRKASKPLIMKRERKTQVKQEENSSNSWSIPFSNGPPKKRIRKEEQPMIESKDLHIRNVSVNTKELEQHHPSWAAKAKLRELPSFEGKRVVFDDDDDDDDDDE